MSSFRVFASDSAVSDSVFMSGSDSGWILVLILFLFLGEEYKVIYLFKTRNRHKNCQFIGPVSI